MHVYYTYMKNYKIYKNISIYIIYIYNRFNVTHGTCSAKLRWMIRDMLVKTPWVFANCGWFHPGTRLSVHAASSRLKEDRKWNKKRENWMWRMLHWTIPRLATASATKSEGLSSSHWLVARWWNWSSHGCAGTSCLSYCLQAGTPAVVRGKQKDSCACK